MLGAAFYFAYFRAPACAPDAACAIVPARVTRLNRGLLWLIAVAVVGIALFPPLAGTLLGGGTLPVGSSSRVTLHIEGMTCPACVGDIRTALEGVPGVRAASLNCTDARALVAVDSPSPAAVDALVRVFEKVGYRATTHVTGADP